MISKPNIIFVHGAWTDGSSWSKVISLLQGKGFNVSAAQIPLTSLADDIATTQRLLSLKKGPTVLVGHSYGGAVVTGAATDFPDVEALVYVAAFGLDQGESLDILSKQHVPSSGATHVHPDANGFLWIDEAGFHEAFAADIDAKEAAIMASVQKPLSVTSYTDKSGDPAWKTIPSWYIVSTNDQMIPPSAQKFMAKRMNATMHSVHASHASMVSHPREVSELVMLAVDSIDS
jgi:pimeloyl-ACP methyl ester carboxylesterase